MTPGVSTDGMPDPSTLPCFSYHQDSGMEKDLEYRPAPRFSMKAGCASLTIHTCFQLTTSHESDAGTAHALCCRRFADYLTDVLEEGMANTWLVP